MVRRRGEVGTQTDVLLSDEEREEEDMVVSSRSRQWAAKRSSVGRCCRWSTMGEDGEFLFSLDLLF
jgi:hypothetical protein